MLNICYRIFFLFIIFTADFALAQNNSKTISPLPQDVSEDEFAEFDTPDKAEIYDPLEKINRKIYVFNDGFDRYFLQHASNAYRAGVPQMGRKGIRNFLNNLTLPLSAINSLLQGKVDNGLATFSNFLINSTVGVLGFRDVANEKEIFYHYEDFGQTMGHYNLGSGAYLMVPFLGPSSTRDFSGFVTTKLISPDSFNILEIGGGENIVAPGYLVSLTMISVVDLRESLDQTINDIRQDSFDPYATIRSAYLQKRANDINK